MKLKYLFVQMIIPPFIKSNTLCVGFALCALGVCELGVAQSCRRRHHGGGDHVSGVHAEGGVGGKHSS